jgi:opacity protein-like surface antigen
MAVQRLTKGEFMKKSYLALLCATSLALPITAQAGEPSFTLNYANSSNSIEAADYGQGLNIKVNYDPSFSSFGLVTSATFTEKSWSDRWMGGNGQGETRYFSMATGPSYWFQPFMSIYALAGFAEQKTVGSMNGEFLKDSDMTYIYGGGLRMNVWESVVLDAHYEYAPFEFDGMKTSTETYSVGLGWRF